MSLADLRLLVGLGNPGRGYEKTRHNLGFLVAQELARRHNWVWKNSSLYKAVLAQGRMGLENVSLLLPQTLMNHSGIAVAKFVQDRAVSRAGMLVVCDDMNLEFGQVRVRKSGSDGGHNGLKSIIAHLGTDDFGRLRLGIGRPPVAVDAADYVLAPFLKVEQKELPGLIQLAADCREAWISDGMDKVMNVFNKRKGYE